MELMTKHGKAMASSPILRKVSLLLDGLSRAAILPYASNLIYTILFQQAELESEDVLLLSWPQVVHPVAITVAMYLLGRWLGTSLAERTPVGHSKLTHFVARVGGVVLALFVFSFGTAVTSTLWLYTLRLVSGFFAGYLCQMTNAKRSNYDYIEEYDEESVISSQKSETRTKYSRVYLLGFTISLLLSGGLFNISKKSSKFRSLAGGDLFPLSPMFFVFISVLGEIGLRIIFWYTSRYEKVSCDEPEVIAPLIPASSYHNFKSRTRYKVSEDHHFESINNSLSPSRSSNRIRTSSEASYRSRINSGGSSEFFDCESFDELEDNEDQKKKNIEKINNESQDTTVMIDKLVVNTSTNVIEYGDHSDTDIAEYRENRCVYSNGSPSFVPQGHCEAAIPKTVLRCCNENEKKASAMWIKMQKWRKENNVWRIHTTPQPFYSRIKEAYPHFIHGYSKIGNPVLYEKPGKMNLKELFRSGCSIEDMVQHYIFCMEYFSNAVCLKEDIRRLHGGKPHSYDTWKNLIIMDVTGISLSHLSGDVVKYLTRAGEVNNNYYPDSMARVLVVNAPFWLAGAWSGIKGVFPESITVDILSTSKALNGMKKYIDEDQIPKEYGGTSCFQEGDHPFEVELRELVAMADKGEKFDSQPILVKTGTMNESITSDTPNNKDQKFFSGKVEGSEDDKLNFGSQIQSTNDKSIPIERQLIESRREVNNPSPSYANTNEQGIILGVISSILILWWSIQGALECIIPLWILTPSMLGGLGYTPLRCCFSFFCISFLILWLMTTHFLRSILTVTKRAPMKVLRVSVASEIILLLMLPVIPNKIVSVARSESIMIMASTIILLTLLALVTILGNASISILHQIACNKYSDNPGEINVVINCFGQERFLSDCKTGKLTFNLGSFSNIVGILAIAPVYVWSTTKVRPTPFDAVFCLLATSFILPILHILSFTFLLNAKGEFVMVGLKKASAIIYDIIAIPMSDMSSLLEEVNSRSTQGLPR